MHLPQHIHCFAIRRSGAETTRHERFKRNFWRGQDWLTVHYLIFEPNSTPVVCAFWSQGRLHAKELTMSCEGRRKLRIKRVAPDESSLDWKLRQVIWKHNSPAGARAIVLLATAIAERMKDTFISQNGVEGFAQRSIPQLKTMIMYLLTIFTNLFKHDLSMKS